MFWHGYGWWYRGWWLLLFPVRVTYIGPQIMTYIGPQIVTYIGPRSFIVIALTLISTLWKSQGLMGLSETIAKLLGDLKTPREPQDVYIYIYIYICVYVKFDEIGICFFF